MAEQFLTLMADLDEHSQQRISSWYAALRGAGFTGTQTAGLPYHISLATFPLEREQEAAELTRRVAAETAPFPVHFSHIGLFAGGKVLFCAPERNPRLDALHGACDIMPRPGVPWTPHTTLLIDEPDAVCAALPVLVASFTPFVGQITRLHLCAFWPAREIVSAALSGRA
ncbi:MAG: 2'-5' RNA ligase family protein [Clostridia bacterium]|nr:2'-5' RNA ligase family protein [Clostridia bacterium]